MLYWCCRLICKYLLHFVNNGADFSSVNTCCSLSSVCSITDANGHATVTEGQQQCSDPSVMTYSTLVACDLNMLVRFPTLNLVPSVKTVAGRDGTASDT